MSLAQVLQSFWPFHGPPDGRSEREIEDDLDAEFAFHLEQAQRDLAHEGHDREAASGLAHARFGDIDRIKRECRRIALKERTMLQRVNFIMMIVVLLMVVAVGVQVLITQRYNTLALQAITAEITNMKYDALAAERHRSSRGDGMVYIGGDVVRTGTYELPQVGTLTLRRAITAAGGVPDNRDASATVTAIGPDGTSALKFKVDSIKTDDSDYVLSPDDHVQVNRIYPQPPPSRQPGMMGLTLPENYGGRWMQVHQNSEPVENGATLDLLSHNDVRNLKSTPVGQLNLRDRDRQFELVFEVMRTPNLNITELNPARTLWHGRWAYDHGQLLVYIAPAVPDLKEPLAFKHVGAGGDAQASTE